MKQQVEKITGRNNYHFTWYCKNRKKDPSNISYAVKFIFDGLEMAGVIENDGWKQISGITHKFEVDKKNPRVVIDIESGEIT